MGKLKNEKLINVGFSNVVFTDRIVAIVTPDSAPIKRMISEARENMKLIDVSFGRKTRAALISDTGHIILSASTVDTLTRRVNEEIIE